MSRDIRTLNDQMNSLRESNRDLAQEVQSHKREYEQLQTVSIWYPSNRELVQEVQSHKMEFQ